MFMTDFVRVCRSADLDRLRALARALDRAGITSVLLPSDRVIATWEIEVPADDAEAARAMVEGTRIS